MKKIFAITFALFSIFSTVACGIETSAGTAQTTNESVAITTPQGETEAKSATTTSERKLVKVGVSGTYVPWCYQEDGKDVGYEIAVWNEIAKRSDFDVEFVNAKFSGLFGLLDSGQIDTIAHQVSETEERKEKYDFSVPYAVSTYSFAVKDDSPYQTEADLMEKKVGVGVGGNGEKTINELNEQENLSLIISTYDSGAGIGIGDVDLGRIDAFWIGTIAGKVTIEQAEYAMHVIESDFVHEVNRYPFAKSEENKVLLAKVDEALTSMTEDGTLQSLAKEWLQVDMNLDNV